MPSLSREKGVYSWGWTVRVSGHRPLRPCAASDTLLRCRLSGVDETVERLRQERDLYRGLLKLGADTDVRAFMEEALRRIVLATGSHQGYLALFGGADLASDPPFAIAHDCSEQDVANVRNSLSGGILRTALEKGVTVSTASALDDPRFKERRSVAAHEIRAVTRSRRSRSRPSRSRPSRPKRSRKRPSRPRRVPRPTSSTTIPITRTPHESRE